MDKQIMCCNKPMIHTSLGYYDILLIEKTIDKKRIICYN